MLILAQFINLATTSFEKQEQTFDRVLIFFYCKPAPLLQKIGRCNCSCANCVTVTVQIRQIRQTTLLPIISR